MLKQSQHEKDYLEEFRRGYGENNATISAITGYDVSKLGYTVA